MSGGITVCLQVFHGVLQGNTLDVVQPVFKSYAIRGVLVTRHHVSERLRWEMKLLGHGLWTLSQTQLPIDLISVDLLEIISVEFLGQSFDELPVAQDLFSQLADCIIQSNALDCDILTLDIHAMILLIHVLEGCQFSLWETETLCHSL